VKPSLRPSNAPLSQIPPSGKRAMDSGQQFFMGGRYYYRQLGDLAVNLCGAKSFSDDDWREYLYGSLEVARELGRGPSVSLIAFMGDHPNAGQRRISAEFMTKERVRPIERVAILTDSDILRHAMTAFGWLVPNLKYRAFKPSDPAGGYAWLGEIAQFDEKKALDAWAEARSALSVPK
jgi:hypothetical protein